MRIGATWRRVLFGVASVAALVACGDDGRPDATIGAQPQRIAGAIDDADRSSTRGPRCRRSPISSTRTEPVRAKKGIDF